MDKNLVWLFPFIVFGCLGLELTLDRDVSPSLSGRATCGVLLCVEESPTATNVTPATQGGSSDYPSPVATISSLKVFKLDATATRTDSGSGGNKRRSLLASVTSQQSRLTRVSNGIKADGSLAAGKATLRLELTKQEDCRAEFVCQSLGEDAQGRELVSSSHILQQPKASGEQVESFGWTGGPVMQVMSLVQQMNAQLAVVDSAVDNWKYEMRSLKNTVQHDIESLQTDLDTKVDRLEDKIQNVGNDLDTQSDRMEDKVESVQKDVNKRAGRLEDKLDTQITRLEDTIHSLADLLKGDVTGQTGSDDSITSTQISSLDVKIQDIKDELAQVATDIKNNAETNFFNFNKQLQAIEKNDQRRFDNLTQSREGATCEDSQTLASEISDGFDSLENAIDEKLHDLSLNVNDTAMATQSLIREKIPHASLTAGTETKSALTDLLKPKACFKGMSSAAFLASSQHSVIQPSQANRLAVPVLCDTFTDGGGWIVFQRRLTGDVNFYRGWEDYKNGFGSLDGDFWLGNENIHAITSTGVFELRIDMIYKGNFAFAHYESFSVGDESSKYALHVAHYDGTAGESLSGHNGRSFTTYDSDNDTWPKNCAIEYVGAWWYENCHSSNLNGQWAAGGNKGPRWGALSGTDAVSYTEMKIRRIV